MASLPPEVLRQVANNLQHDELALSRICLVASTFRSIFQEELFSSFAYSPRQPLSRLEAFLAAGEQAGLARCLRSLSIEFEFEIGGAVDLVQAAAKIITHASRLRSLQIKSIPAHLSLDMLLSAVERLSQLRRLSITCACLAITPSGHYQLVYAESIFNMLARATFSLVALELGGIADNAESKWTMPSYLPALQLVTRLSLTAVALSDDKLAVLADAVPNLKALNLGHLDDLPFIINPLMRFSNRPFLSAPTADGVLSMVSRSLAKINTLRLCVSATSWDEEHVDQLFSLLKESDLQTLAIEAQCLALPFELSLPATIQDLYLSSDLPSFDYNTQLLNTVWLDQLQTWLVGQRHIKYLRINERKICSESMAKVEQLLQTCQERHVDLSVEKRSYSRSW